MEDEMYRAYSTKGVKRKAYRIFMGKPDEKTTMKTKIQVGE
jgi:hypothetical protein